MNGRVQTTYVRASMQRAGGATDDSVDVVVHREKALRTRRQKKAGQQNVLRGPGTRAAKCASWGLTVRRAPCAIRLGAAGQEAMNDGRRHNSHWHPELVRVRARALCVCEPRQTRRHLMLEAHPLTLQCNKCHAPSPSSCGEHQFEPQTQTHLAWPRPSCSIRVGLLHASSAVASCALVIKYLRSSNV